MIRILYVDDDRLLLDLTKEFLEQQEDFQVGTTSSAEEALQMLSKQEYDVVVSDYKMPEMDGLEFLSELRGQGNGIPFVMFTGKGREEVAVEAFVRGADGYVMKGGDPAAQYAELASWIKSSVARRKAQDALRESEEKYRTLVELAHDGILDVGEDYTIRFANPRIGEMLGYTAEEFIGKDYRELLEPDARKDSLRRREQRRRNGERQIFERRLFRKDGTNIDTLCSTSPMQDEEGNYSGSLAIFTDITERKKMEDEIKKSEERYRRLFELSPDGILTIDMKGTITSVNQTFEKRTGYSRDDVVGRHFSKLQTLRVKDIPRYLRMFSTFLKGKLPEPFEIEYKHKDGTQGWSMTHASFIEEEGKKAGVQIVMPDITPRKRIEDRERFLHSLLRHDLRNNAQGIYGYLELLSRIELSEKQAKYVETLKESVQKNIALMSKITELVTLDESKDLVNVDLDLAIRDAVEEASASAEKQEVAINYKGTPRAVVRANTLLKNVFTNLIGNSIKHADCRQIQITVRELKDRYHITVKDDGKGIPKSVRDKIFEKGVKVIGSIGSGLGLHLVKRIIEASNGTIELKDEKKGTRFDIYLKKSGSTQGE